MNGNKTRGPKFKAIQNELYDFVSSEMNEPTYWTYNGLINDSDTNVSHNTE